MSDSETFNEEYRTGIRRKVIVICIGALTVFVMLIANVSMGDNPIGFFDTIQYILDHLTGVEHDPGSPEWLDQYVVWYSRLPRALGGAIAGASLAVCGAAMQSMLKNPLVDPFITGISSGAVLGVVIGISMGMTMYGAGQYAMLSLSFVFALIPMALIVMFSRFSRGSIATVLLIGIAISSVFGSLSTLIMVSFDETALQQAVTWQVGTLSKITWNSLPLMTASTVLGMIFLMFTSNRLNLLTLGDRSARSLGLNADNYRTVSMVVVSLMCASIICYTGIIGFLGLVVPHMVRMFIGSDNRYLIPVSAVFGASFMLFCDCISKSVNVAGVPVGVVLSALGGPLFLLLILKSKKGTLKNDAL